MNAEILTQYPELDGVLQDHAERLQEALGDFLVGVYLVGSLPIGVPTKDHTGRLFLHLYESLEIA